jgi:transcriptional regulator with XRE-family HTH domain
MDIYGNIRTLAAKKGYSIRQLEEKLGFGNGTFRRWNTNSPSIDKVIKVADALNVTVEELVGKENRNKMAHNVDIYDEGIGTLAAHMKDRNHKFTPDEVDRIIGYLDGIIDADQAKKKNKED